MIQKLEMFSGLNWHLSACGVWEVRAKVQVSRRELHTHIYLD